MAFLERFSEIIKIRPVGAELFHADEKTETGGQTRRS